MKRNVKIFFTIYYMFWFGVFFIQDVDAYIDPSVMTYAIQAID